MKQRLEPGSPQHLQLLEAVAGAFRPAAPIDRRDLFSGRTEQIADLLDVFAQPGQHAVVYGERGVGKTSLVTVAAQIAAAGGAVAARATCDTSDDFGTAWRKALDEIQLTYSSRGVGFAPQAREAARAAGSLLGSGPVTPHAVRRALHGLGQQKRVVIFVDEFDRLTSKEARVLFADTIKTLSDQLVSATIVLVGVADDVDELVAEHRSVERALVQIHMPRMSPAELGEIVTRGIARAGMTIDAEPVERIARLSQGLPHYTHLLAQLAARAALAVPRTHVTSADLDEAVGAAIGRAQQSVMDAYHRATSSTRRTLFPQVVLAASLAPGDDFGFFAASDLRDAMEAITGKPCDVRTFAAHLDELSGDERGPVLQKRGAPRRYRYRFANPLLQPYVIMRGLSEGRIDPNALTS